MALVLGASSVSAQPAPVVAEVPIEVADEPPPPEPSVRTIDIHGFLSEGAFWSTSNNYIGDSARGSLELFEAGVNISTEVTDRLRAGVQIFARDFGSLDDDPRFDWAFLDYRFRPWLGLRAGSIKVPFGLYNEYIDIDSARLPILMPPSIYSFLTRDVLLSHRGFALYGETSLASAGELEYQGWAGSLNIPHNALAIPGGTLTSIDTRYALGAQVFWRPPIEGLRVGGSYVRALIDIDIALDAASVNALTAAGVVPADFDGHVQLSQEPDRLMVASAEYTRGPWLLAAEYCRLFSHQESSLPALFPTSEDDNERFYGMVAYRHSSLLEVGGYYSVLHLDVDDRGGHDTARFPERFYAFQRDLAATLRFDINDHWLWKIEGHFIDGTADLPRADNPKPDRYWGLVLARTTVTF